MRPTLPFRSFATTAIALLLAGTTSLAAHAVVEPAEAPVGAYQRYVLRVPNERDVATRRIEIVFPEAVRVIAFADVPGWRLDTEAGETAGTFARATWTGTLPPGRFVELPFLAVNPAQPTKLAWRVSQTYAGGETVEWSGPEGSNTPASFTVIRDGPAPNDGDDEADEAAADPDEAAGDLELPALAGLALAVALLALVVAIRKRGA